MGGRFASSLECCKRGGLFLDTQQPALLRSKPAPDTTLGNTEAKMPADDSSKKLVDRSSDLLKEIQKIEKVRDTTGISQFEVNMLASRAGTLFQSALGPRSLYDESIKNALKQKSTVGQYAALAGVLQAFHFDLAEGHLINIRHEVEAIVVSEIVSQARKLLGSKSVHPAAAVMVACAGAEEFLRNWCTEKSISIPERQRSIGKFATELRLAGHIELPVERRIAAWADYRNDAAHGANWSKITSEIAGRLVLEIEGFLVEYKTVLG